MFNCHTGTASMLATPHKQRNSILKHSKRSSKESRAHYRGAGNCNPLRQGLRNGILKVL
ncbi:hypothetical protein H8356DRAFT_1332726 [Neocallimastix lanati (nom. inval.)]|nr:hypothetical protein H8356DRAFT_1332726 [Neocallimastix sp. JGI-2020a]